MHSSMLVALPERIAEVTDGRVDITIHSVGLPPAQWGKRRLRGDGHRLTRLHVRAVPSDRDRRVADDFSSGQQAPAALQHLYDNFLEI